MDLEKKKKKIEIKKNGPLHLSGISRGWTTGYNFVDQGLKLKRLLDKDTVGKMVENKLHKIWGWFTSFGTIISTLLEIFVIWKVITTALNNGLNISILYQTFGRYLKLLAVIFSSLTQYVIHISYNKQFSHKENIQQPIHPGLEIVKLPKKKIHHDSIRMSNALLYKEQSYQQSTNIQLTRLITTFYCTKIHQHKISLYLMQIIKICAITSYNQIIII